MENPFPSDMQNGLSNLKMEMDFLVKIFDLDKLKKIYLFKSFI